MTKIRSLPACAFFRASLTRGTLAWAALAVLAPSAIGQLQFDELRKGQRQHLPPDSDLTLAVALGDVDGDGDAGRRLDLRRQQGWCGEGR